MGQRRLVIALGVVYLLAFPTLSAAQLVGGAIQGVVKDAQGATLPGASILIRNVATGVVHEQTTDRSGHYQMLALSPAEYEVQISLTGFRTVAHRGIRLTVGQTAVIDTTLELGVISETIEVRGDAVTVNLASGAVAGLVGEREIRDLPLNGRSFQQLALMQPGVQAALAAGNDVVGGRTPKISINGTRPEMNSFLLDGTDISNVYNKTPGSAAGVLLGVEAVLEFQVLTNAYSAEFGRSAGGVFNAVTRSGTNRYHGSVFEFHRNSALDARNFFDPPSLPKPDFTRHQFGGVFGGPVQQDRTFFFAAYEGLIERLGVTGVTAVPDDDARRGIIAGRTIALHPQVPRYLDVLFPRANGRSLGNGGAEYLFTDTQPTDEHLYQLRIDHRPSAANGFFGRVTHDRADVTRIPPNKPPIAILEEATRNTYVTGEWQRTFSQNTLNQFRVGLNRSVSLADNRRTIDIPPDMAWLPGEKFGYLTIQGLVTEMAGDFRLPRNDRLNNWQLSNMLISTRGRHLLKIGGQLQYMQFNQDTTSQAGGIVTFNNLELFLTGRPSNVDFAVPGKIDPIRKYRQWLFAGFVQDDVRLTDRLSMNLGLRYEAVTVPTEVDGKISNLRNVTDLELTIGDPWHDNPSLLNFAPRVGLAWDPRGSGRTAVRAGFGIFHDQILPKYYFFSGSLNPPFTTRTSIVNPPFPNVIANFDSNAYIRAQLQTVNFDLQTPYVMQFNASVQRQFTDTLDVTVGYVGSRGHNLIRLGDANLAPETIVNGVKTYQPAAGRRNPNFTGVWQRMTDARSFYDSLQVAVNRRYGNGWRAQLSYTLSESTDDASGINSQDFSNNVQYVSDWYDLSHDRGLSAFHARHNLTANASWELPFASTTSGVTAALLKGWQLNGIATLRSGHPFTVELGFNRSGNLNTTGFSRHERPDLKPGCSENPVLGGWERYWDVSCFQLPAANTRGNLGRNTLIGPGLVSIDASLVKSFALAGSRTLQVKIEAFNLPNRANFAVPSGRIAFTGVSPDGTPVVAPTWGRITSTVTTSRQIQVGAKLTF
ncbi:MAG TPA: TonB-dependent receptor [Vicinamibacterales bacterium]|nr:TonB-dependent receptor [Vicinamibacterales bacterium]